MPRFPFLLGWLLIAGGCASLPPNVNAPPSFAFIDTENTEIGRRAAEYAAEHPGQSGFFLLGNGLDAFVARAVLAAGAERSIDAQYYLIHSDLTGKLFIHQLVKAADRGVRVRLLVDDIDLGDRDLGARILDSHANIEVRIFNPFARNVSRLMQYVTRLGTVTRRMHNKSFTIDNQAAILGGRNIGNEYFEANPEIAFADLDVLTIGPVVSEVSTAFDLYWNSEFAYPASLLIKRVPTAEEIAEATRELDAFFAAQVDSDYMKSLRNSELAQRLRADDLVYYWGGADAIYDQPHKIESGRDQSELHLSDDLEPYMQTVAKELIIFSPYFVPGKDGVQALTRLREQGVAVKILTNSLASTDVGIVHAGYKKYRKALLRAGVALYEMDDQLTRAQRKQKKGPAGSSKASLHAKSFVLDRKQVFIGSLNLDPRSVYENTEIGVMLGSPALATDMAEWFDQNVREMAFELSLWTNDVGNQYIHWRSTKDGRDDLYYVDPYTSFWRRLGVNIMSIFPIESQL